MLVRRLKPSRVLGIEHFTDFCEFRANEVLGLGTSTPLRPRDFSLTRAILPLQDGLLVFQRSFARRLEVDIGTDHGVGLVVPFFSYHSITNGREIDSSMVNVVRGRVPIKCVENHPNTYLMMRFNSDMRHRGWADYDSGLGFFRSHDAPMARLRAVILHMFGLASELNDPRQFEALNRPIQETLLASLDATLVPADRLAARRGSFDKHRKLIARLDELVALFGSRPLYSDDLAAALGVSARTLQTANARRAWRQPAPLSASQTVVERSRAAHDRRQRTDGEGCSARQRLLAHGRFLARLQIGVRRDTIGDAGARPAPLNAAVDARGRLSRDRPPCGGRFR